MSNKKKIKKKPSGGASQAKAHPEAELSGPPPLNIILPAAVAIITLILYRYTFHNQFLDWDDWIYVQKDPFITSFSWHNIKMMLFHNITRNYFHPITMLSLAFNYHFSKLDPSGYYITNVLIHSINTIVIFFFVKRLLEAMTEHFGYDEIEGIPWLAALCALFHGVHPMHVESVAWMVERKDLLYACFYFLGLTAYIKYIKEENMKNLGVVVILYGCSLLSKPMAVSFPLSLFAMDVLFKREGWKRLIIEKWPFFLVSLGGGIAAFYTARDSGSIAFLHGFTLLHKLTVPFYSFMMYAVKAFVPYHLCGYYPYPEVSNGWIPMIFYVAPLICAAMVGIPLYFAYKAGENYFRITLFGIGFYFANVLFILQFLSAGVAIMCERYSYVGYFGIFFLITYFVSVLIKKYPTYRIPVFAGIAVFVGSLAYVCDGRTKVWHDSESFWHDVIVKYPRQWLVPYMNLGQWYVDKSQAPETKNEERQPALDSAFANYNILVSLHSTQPEVYRNLANLYAMKKDYDRSIELYADAIKFDTANIGDTYLDRAVTYSIMGKLDLALQDYNKAYQKDSNSEKVLTNRGYAYLSLGQYDKSIVDFNHLIRLNPGEPYVYFRRGIAELNLKQIDNSIKDFNKSLSILANNPECIYDLSIAYKSANDFPNALNYAIKAKQAGYKVDDSYLTELQKGAGITK